MAAVEYTAKHIERFWSKVNIGNPNECWEWGSSRNKKGYGQFTLYDRKSFNVKAHRMAWEVTNGKIPDGLFVCHHCDNPPCCNPAHLFVGTNSDNMKDASSKGRLRLPRIPQFTKSVHTKRRKAPGELRSDNTSGYKGVIFDKERKNWRAQIRANGKRYRSKGYPTPEDAYVKYCEMSIQYRGDPVAKRRQQQTNRPETCPLCGKNLTNRAAAMSHYRGHAKAGLLLEKDGMFCASDYPYNGCFVWWNGRGIQLNVGIDETLTELRDRWHRKWFSLWVSSPQINQVRFEPCNELS